MDPPEEPPPKPTPPPMKMQGKIVRRGRCLFCPGSYILLLPEGETKTRLMHNDPWCKKFEDDPQGYMEQHNTFARKAKPTESKKEKQKRRKQGRRR
jgi:hypothetical protein